MMTIPSYYRIVLIEYFPKLIEKLWRKMWLHKDSTQPGAVENIDKFLIPPPRGHVLVILSQMAWLDALNAGVDLKFFNIRGLTFEVVKAFNQLGYFVDIVSMLNPDAILPRSAYDAVFAHGPNCRKIIESLPPETPVIHYASGAYWKEFNKMSQERYEEFAARNNLPVARDFIRSLLGSEDGEEYLARRADFTFLSGPRTVATFDGVCRNMELLYLGSYIDHALRDIDRDFDAGRKNFIYVAGTGGNIQKGMDILIEVFSKFQDLHLYIYCAVEDEILDVYRHKLTLPNIHYVYYLRFPIFKQRLKRLMSRINFTVTAPIDTGPGTALIGSLGLGFIPVGYSDIEGTEEDSCLSSDWRIPSIMSRIRAASEKSVEWCARASRLNVEKYERLHNPEIFGVRFREYVAGILSGQTDRSDDGH